MEAGGVGERYGFKIFYIVTSFITERINTRKFYTQEELT